MDLYYVRNDQNVAKGGTSNIQVQTKDLLSSILNLNKDNLDISEIDCWSNLVLSIMNSRDDSIYFIESDIVPSFKELFNLVKYTDKTIYLRWHESLLYSADRFADDTYLDPNQDENLGRWYQLCSLNPNLTLVVTTEFDAKLCDLLNIKYILDLSMSRDSFITPNLNTSNKLYHSELNNKLLYVVGSYRKIKGVLSVFYAILSDVNNKYEWYLVGSIFNKYTESSRDSVVLRGLFELIKDKPNVHIIDYASDITEYYKLCSRVIIASPYEGTSFTAREALSYGCRVVCYDTIRSPFIGDGRVDVVDTNGEYLYLNLGKILYDAIDKNKYRDHRYALPTSEGILSRYFINLCKYKGMLEEYKYLNNKE